MANQEIDNNKPQYADEAKGSGLDRLRVYGSSSDSSYKQTDLGGVQRIQGGFQGRPGEGPVVLTPRGKNNAYYRI